LGLVTNVGTPSTKDFKAILQMNLIANNPVINKDIEIAEQILMIMKIRGQCVDIFSTFHPNNIKTLPKKKEIRNYLISKWKNMAWDSTIISALLQEISIFLEEIGFKINLYNPCVANRKINKNNIQSPGALTI
jgi:hypothetical protein